MKPFLFFLVPFLIYGCHSAPAEDATNTDKAVEKSIAPTSFDSTLAKQLGADDYGMRSYVMAFLKRGPNRPEDSLERIALQRAHMDNIGRLADEGKLVLAGPFMSDGELRGIYIFDTPSVDSARAFTQTDPAIQKGSLIMELVPWYGSAALMQVNEVHQRIAKVNI